MPAMTHVLIAGYTDHYCPVTDDYEEQKLCGDTGPSEPLCTGCNEFLTEENTMHVPTGVAA